MTETGRMEAERGRSRIRGGGRQPDPQRKVVEEKEEGESRGRGAGGRWMEVE